MISLSSGWVKQARAVDTFLSSNKINYENLKSEMPKVLFITGFDVMSLSKTDWLGILSGVGAGLAYTSIRELRKHVARILTIKRICAIFKVL